MKKIWRNISFFNSVHSEEEEYCHHKPTLEPPTPTEGTLNIPPGGGKIALKAKSPHGKITRFIYNRPANMSCDRPNPNGETVCTFTPKLHQQGTSHNFCFSADDSLGPELEII